MRLRKLLRGKRMRKRASNDRVKLFLAARRKTGGLYGVGHSTLSRKEALELQEGPPTAAGEAGLLSPVKPRPGGPS